MWWWFIFFNEVGGRERQDALAPIRARGDKAEGGRSLFSLSDTLLCFAFSRVSFVYHFTATGRRRKKAELPARSCPILPDINNVKSKKEQGGHDRK
jgi:hypothetical protein